MLSDDGLIRTNTAPGFKLPPARVRLGLAVATLVLMVGTEVAPSAIAGKKDIDEARQFDRFRVYFAGHRVLGLDLFRFERWGSGPGAEVLAVYGECVPSGPGVCSFELEISNTSICQTHPKTYYHRPKLRPINGAMGGWVRGAKVFDVYTGRTAVSISGLSRRNAKRVAWKLIDVRKERRRKQLPSVKPRYLRGAHKCQQ